MPDPVTFAPVEIGGIVREASGSNGLTYKAVPAFVTTKVADARPGEVEALVSVTDVLDSVEDIVLSNAYAKTLAKVTPKIVWSHDWDIWVAKVTKAEEWYPGDKRLPPDIQDLDGGALYLKMLFNLDSTAGKDAYSNVKFFSEGDGGNQTAWSIGYQVEDADLDKKTGIRRIKSLRLLEASPVLHGAMPLAQTLSVKAMATAARERKAHGFEPGASLREIERITLLAQQKDTPMDHAFVPAAPARCATCNTKSAAHDDGHDFAPANEALCAKCEATFADHAKATSMPKPEEMDMSMGKGLTVDLQGKDSPGVVTDITTTGRAGTGDTTVDNAAASTPAGHFLDPGKPQGAGTADPDQLSHVHVELAALSPGVAVHVHPVGGAGGFQGGDVVTLPVTYSSGDQAALGYAPKSAKAAAEIGNAPGADAYATGGGTPGQDAGTNMHVMVALSSRTPGVQLHVQDHLGDVHDLPIRYASLDTAPALQTAPPFTSDKAMGDGMGAAGMDDMDTPVELDIPAAKTYVAATDAALDAAMVSYSTGDNMTAWSLTVAASMTIDSAMDALCCPDPDEDDAMPFKGLPRGEAKTASPEVRLLAALEAGVAAGRVTTKAGAVLSSANMTKIEAAVKTLVEVLQAAGADLALAPAGKSANYTKGGVLPSGIATVSGNGFAATANTTSANPSAVFTVGETKVAPVAAGEDEGLTEDDLLLFAHAKSRF